MRLTNLKRRARLVVTLAMAATMALLAACSGGPTPAIVLDLDRATAVVIRGTSIDVIVTLTRLGGATDPIDLDVDGLPAGVTASFGPATLSGATLESTLTLQVAAGASDGSAGLTVTGSGGTVTDDAALTLTIESQNVNGRVEGIVGMPLAGITVSSQGQTDFTDANGEFTLTGLSLPYDLVVSAAVSSGAMHVFEGMTRDDPVVSPAFAFLLFLGVSGYEATLDGSLFGGPLLAPGETVVVCVEGLFVPVLGCDAAAAGDGTYSFDAAWYTTGPVEVRVHALHVETGPDGTPSDILGYDSFETTLTDGAIESNDLALAAVGSQSVTGTIEEGAGVNVSTTVGYVRFGPNLSMPLFQSSSMLSDIDALMPDVPGTSYDFLAAGTTVGGASYAWTADVGTDAGTVTVPAAPQLVAPADAATGVTAATTFTVSDAGAPQMIYWSPQTSGPMVFLTTERTSVTFPHPALGGFAFPAGETYAWSVLGIGASSMDDAGVRGLTEFYELTFGVTFGGPGFASDGSLTTEDGREFTFAP